MATFTLTQWPLGIGNDFCRPFLRARTSLDLAWRYHQPTLPRPPKILHHDLWSQYLFCQTPQRHHWHLPRFITHLTAQSLVQNQCRPHGFNSRRPFWILSLSRRLRHAAYHASLLAHPVVMAWLQNPRCHKTQTILLLHFRICTSRFYFYPPHYLSCCFHCYFCYRPSTSTFHNQDSSYYSANSYYFHHPTWSCLVYR